MLQVATDRKCKQCASQMFWSMNYGFYCPKMACPLCPKYKAVKA